MGGGLGQGAAGKRGAEGVRRPRGRPLGACEAFGAAEGRDRARGVPGSSVCGSRGDPRNPGRDGQVAHAQRTEGTEGHIR